MRSLFQSGVVFFIIAGISFLAATITTVKYFMTDDGSAAPTGGVVANGVVMLVIGIVLRKRSTKTANQGAPATETRP